MNTRRIIYISVVGIAIGLAALIETWIEKPTIQNNPDIQSTPNSASATRLVESYGKLPLSFEANQGQTDQAVQFLSRGPGYTLFLKPTEAVLSLNSRQAMTPNPAKRKFDAIGTPQPREAATATVSMKLLGANPTARPSGLDELPGKVNYLRGNDAKQWRTNIPTYGKVRYKDVYPGIDLVYYGNQRQLEYDLMVRPGADPKSVRLTFDGADKLDIDARGNLLLKTALGDVSLKKPFIYQVTEGTRKLIEGSYMLSSEIGNANSDTHIILQISGYDKSKPLIIDPVLVFSTYLGGTADDNGWGIALDSAGNAYVTGYTFSSNFPTQNPVPGTLGGRLSDAFVAKLNAAGNALIYSTYLGGYSNDFGRGIAVDSTGNAYVTGETDSPDFPTQSPFQGAMGGGGMDSFVAKINAAGNALLYSTYLGGTADDIGWGIAVDSAGNAYVAGETTSPDFPTQNPVPGTLGGRLSDAFVSKLNAAGNALIYATYLGGSDWDFGRGIAVDSAGNAYVTGETYSLDFPTQNPLQGAMGGLRDGFVAKINAAGNALGYSTYLGGYDHDYGRGIAVDSAGNAYVTGVTNSPNFPTQNPLQGLSGVWDDTFVAKLNAAGNFLVYSTYVGGTSVDSGYGIAVDIKGNAYVTGSTHSPDFPTANPLQANLLGIVGGDAFIAKISDTLSVSPLRIDFGSQPINIPSTTKPLTVTNNSNQPVQLGTLGKTGQNPGDFAISADTCSNISIAAATSCTFDVIFTPSASGSRTAVVQITDGTSVILSSIPLSGTGTVVPPIVPSITSVSPNPVIGSDSPQPFTINGVNFISGATVTLRDLHTEETFPNRTISSFSSTQIVLNPNFTSIASTWTVEVINPGGASSGQFQFEVVAPLSLSVSPTNLNFGTISKAARPVTVTNTGTQAIQLGNVTRSGADYLDFLVPATLNSCDGKTLASQASCTFNVVFWPTASGPRSAQVQIPSVSPSGLITIAVSGSGDPPARETVAGTAGCVISACTAEPVNSATGNYFYQHTDLSLPGRGLPLVFTRTHNVQDVSPGPLGSGWTHSYNLHLTENSDGSVVVRMGDGHQEYYDPIGGGAYQPHDPGVFNTLVKNANGSFLLTQKNQTRLAFNTSGQLTAISDRNGNNLGFAYNGAGNLTTITDTVGRVLTLNYDASLRLVSISDPLGRTVQYAYDVNGRLASDIDPKGGAQLYQYDAGGLLDKITDRNGHTLVANTYDANKRVVTQTNGKGAVTNFAYDTPAAGQTSITDARGGVTIHTHDVLRRLITETDPLGHVVSYVYDPYNNRTSVTDRNGKVTAFTYDASGNVTSKTDAKGNVSTIQYNSYNDPTKIVDALGGATNFAYDAQGNLISITDALGHITTIAYDVHGQPTSVSDPLNRVTTNSFDASGNLVQVQDALGNKTAFAYDAIGRRTSLTDAKNQVASFVYDANGNLLSVTNPLGHATTYVYDAQNNRTGVTDPRGNITQYAYDAANRLVQVTDALGKATALAYDANGNLLTQTNPLGHTASFVYDDLNRLVSATDALNHQGSRTYDALGRLIQSQDAGGRITQYAYDALSRLVKVTDPAGGMVSYAYDAVGNRTGVTDPNGHASQMVYDALNRLAQKSDPLGNLYHYAYDAVGNRISLTDAKNQLIQYVYDANHRLTDIQYPTGTDNVTFSYDAAGNRTQMNDKLGVSTYVYDALNRLNAYTDPFGKTVANEYDQAGNRTALVYPDGKRVTYGYDPLNRMASVTDWLNGVTNYNYDDASNLAQVVNPNQTAAKYTYDPAERLVQLANVKLVDNGVLASYTLNLDAVGNRTAINRTEPVAPILQGKTETYAYDDDNRLVNLNGNAFIFDANGNQTQGQTNTYNYDFEDRLVAVSGSGTADYGYDGTGNRLKAIRNGTETRYTLDIAGPLANVLVENDAVGNPQAYYVHGLGLISRITPTGDARYYHYDTIGSTVAMTDSAGTVTNAYAYDAFGQVLNEQNAANAVNNPFRYVGQFGVMEEGNGLQFMRARYYDWILGRFFTKDPLLGNPRNSQSNHQYLYALNNPLLLADSNGLSAKELVTPYIGTLNQTKTYVFSGHEKLMLYEAKDYAQEKVKDWAFEWTSYCLKSPSGCYSPIDVEGLIGTTKGALGALTLADIAVSGLEEFYLQEYTNKSWEEKGVDIGITISIKALTSAGKSIPGIAPFAITADVAYEQNKEAVQEAVLRNPLSDFLGGLFVKAGYGVLK